MDDGFRHPPAIHAGAGSARNDGTISLGCRFELLHAITLEERTANNKTLTVFCIRYDCHGRKPASGGTEIGGLTLINSRCRQLDEGSIDIMADIEFQGSQFAIHL